MKLQDFLKCKKVQCVKGYDCLTVGKEYSVLDTRIEVKVKDNTGDLCYWESDHFEPVMPESETSADSVDLHPEFEVLDNHVSEPKFKVGDKVYVFGKSYITKIAEFSKDGEIAILPTKTQCHLHELCHATQENYERLQATFPDIKFEAPPKQLIGSHLTRLLCVRGKRRIYGYASNDKDMDLTGREALCYGYNSDGFLLAGLAVPCKYFVPADIDTGAPLTDAVLKTESSCDGS